MSDSFCEIIMRMEDCSDEDKKFIEDIISEEFAEGTYLEHTDYKSTFIEIMEWIGIRESYWFVGTVCGEYDIAMKLIDEEG
jgi:hypothetical protein